MLILRRIEVVGLTLLFVLFAAVGIAQSDGHSLMAQKTILDKDTAVYSISNCTALVVLSKDQCSACGNSIPELSKKLAKLGYESSFAIVMDRGLMDCKNDEFYLKSVFDPDPPIFFLKDKTVTYKGAGDLEYQSIHLKTTPSLILFTDSGTTVVHSPDVMDDYAKVQSLVMVPRTCLKSKSKKPFFQRSIEGGF